MSSLKTAERISPQEALKVFREEPILDLGVRAQEIRFQKNPRSTVTFVIDSNPNYTNACVTDCSFCAFYRKPGSPEAYTLTLEQVMEKIQWAAERGATTVLLQGGHNPSIPLSYYLELVNETKKRFPQVTPHFFTASEIQTMAQVSGLPLKEVLERLFEAGQRSIPGGGAEILSERVRMRIAPKKGGPQKWLEVHRAAHQIGFKTTATMMYGHLETPEDIVEHLENIRRLQDETAGFTAFIPWSFKPNHTPLEKRVPHGSTANDYLRMIAFSRIYLDNFPHVQASWFSEGKKTGQAALHFGADDFGGTIFEENVHKATDHVVKTTVDEAKTLIREAGFVPAQRTTFYEIIKEFPN
ncbi:MAG: dehypoxanthine futalosine cyclase [Elusimicrobia bacterium RIFCSPLOWO2_01_FULL_54_10]|nr:MAG: dehypoxanthine futalosine cyclase [Elusimicrobia bacterium RIFCSPLOWO2_01_FULL_54_10]